MTHFHILAVLAPVSLLAVLVFQALERDDWIAAAGVTLWMKLFLSFALSRHAHPDEIAGMVAYLAGPESGMVTGASLLIDGGFAA